MRILFIVALCAVVVGAESFVSAGVGNKLRVSYGEIDFGAVSFKRELFMMSSGNMSSGAGVEFGIGYADRRFMNSFASLNIGLSSFKSKYLGFFVGIDAEYFVRLKSNLYVQASAGLILDSEGVFSFPCFVGIEYLFVP